jgi:hypothetical protein
MATRSVIRTAALLALAALAFCPAEGRVQEPRRDAPAAGQDQARDFMRHKMGLTQDALAGLTEGDLVKVGTAAKNMRFLGYFEKHLLAERPEYKRQVAFFDFASQELVRQAEAKNLEGATLAYMQLTATCVQCHKVMRTAKP